MALLNFSTEIDAWRTVSEIQEILAKAGASHFSIRNQGAQPAAVSFTTQLNGQPLNYVLPCNVSGIRKHLEKPCVRQRLRGKQLDLDLQASRVGWRILKDWIEAQCALIEIEMTTIDEVFLPHLIINNAGDTLASKVLKPGGLKLLNL